MNGGNEFIAYQDLKLLEGTYLVL